jgi:hypothetical protein
MAKIEENIINNSTVGALKQSGIHLIIGLITKQAMIFADRIIPSLEKQLIKFDKECPTPEEVANVIFIRNNVLDQANTISNILKGFKITLGLAKFGIDSLIKLIVALKIAKTGVSLGSKFIPVIPGAIVSGLSDLDDLITNKTFDKFGNSKIAPIKFAIDGFSVPVALMSFYVNDFIKKLESLDEKIQTCSPPNTITLPQPSPELVEIAQVEQQAEESPNLSTYQGFILEIEKVPYSPTVDRIRALGKNQDGIVLIQTELSFTQVEQIMINELKFIIDRDNLKAY